MYKSPYIILHIIWLYLFLWNHFLGQEPSYSPMVYQDSIEEMSYDISLYGLSIGRIDAVIGKDTLFRGQKLYKAHVRVYSLVSLPFLGVEDNHYYTLFHVIEDKIIPIFHWKDDIDEKELMEYSCDFNSSLEKIDYYYQKTSKKKSFFWDLWGSCGVMPIIYLRMFSSFNASYRLPIYINFKKSSLDVKVFPKTQRPPFIWKNQKETIFTVAKSNFEGIWGFSGLVHIWLSADEKRLPLGCRVFTELGTVEIRMSLYQRYAK